MSCYVFNETNGRLSNSNLAKKLFDGENTLIVPQIGDDINTSNDANVCLIWHVKNKYYEADISVCVSSVLIRDNTSVPPVGAIIYYTDNIFGESNCNTETKKIFIGRLERWLNSHVTRPIESHSTENHSNYSEVQLEADRDSEDVRLIVAENFVSEDIKSATLSWALNKGVEVIDLNDEEENEICSSHETELDESKRQITRAGNKRVLEALQTFPWASLRSHAKENEGKKDNINDESDKNRDSVGGDFEELMSKLSTFKQTSDALPQNERHAFAEQIALNFYSAMGGDEEESDSLD